MSLRLADHADIADIVTVDRTADQTADRTVARITGFFRRASITSAPFGEVPALFPCLPDDPALSVIRVARTYTSYHRPWELTWSSPPADYPRKVQGAIAYQREEIAKGTPTITGDIYPEIFERFPQPNAHEQMAIAAWRARVKARIASHEATAGKIA